MKHINEIKIGVLILLAILIAYFGINYLKGLNILKKTNDFTVNIPSLNGVNIATPVLVEGYKIGLVNKIDFNYNTGHGATIVLGLNKNLRIPRNSFVSIRQTALSGAEVELHLGDMSAGCFEIGDQIPYTEGDLDIMSNVSKNIMPQIVTFLPKLDSLASNLNALSTNEDIYLILKNIGILSKNLNLIASNLNHSINSGIEPILSNLKKSTNNLNQFSHSLTMMDLNSLIQELQTVASNTQNFTQKLKDEDGLLNKLLTNKSLSSRIDSITTATNTLIKNTDSLMIDIRKNPKRYVHFSLF